ncbi:MAG: hypothetical protein ACE37F_38205 [Nannocystaceae bacterium]|nr:hypothetical protein [bacterium]
MIRGRLRSLLAAGMLVALLPSCARIMHPERVGNRSGTVDVGPLVIDLLLFIPGLIPGVIAIAVDFGTGAIYVRNDAASLEDSGLRLELAGDAVDGYEVLVLDDVGTVVARGGIDPHDVASGAMLTLQPVTQPFEDAVVPGDTLAAR